MKYSGWGQVTNWPRIYVTIYNLLYFCKKIWNNQHHLSQFPWWWKGFVCLLLTSVKTDSILIHEIIDESQHSVMSCVNRLNNVSTCSRCHLHSYCLALHQTSTLAPDSQERHLLWVYEPMWYLTKRNSRLKFSSWNFRRPLL